MMAMKAAQLKLFCGKQPTELNNGAGIRVIWQGTSTSWLLHASSLCCASSARR
jgi:hypothetical protein